MRAAATPVKGREDTWSAEVNGLVRSGGSVREGETLHFGAGISVTILECGTFGHRRVRMCWKGDVADAFAATGHIPLPPYIKRSDAEEDFSRYQTIYSREEKTGSVAAPTAGLHFTDELRETLRRRGFQWAEVTLYVGYGTFSPVRCEDIRNHQMHREYVELPEETANAIAEAKARHRPVIAVGTTSCRTLEAVWAKYGKIVPCSGTTDIFLYPGVELHAIDGLVTNFHLPESTLIMLISAFYGYEKTMAAYKVAVQEKYRFFSFGDAMFMQ